MENPNTTTVEQNAAITQALKKILGKHLPLGKYYDYYEGRHPINFASDKFKTVFGQRVQTFRDNLCKTAVRAPSDRLEVVGFAQESNTAFYTESWPIWKRSQMPKLSRRVHREAFKTGDGYLIVWADDAGKARMYPQDSRNCAVWYNGETGKIDHGAKLWSGPADSDFVYLTLYYADRIEKYISNNKQSKGNTPTTAAGYQVRQVPGEAFPLPVEYEICPMLHFGLECSILDDVIPLNDALNKECADLLISSEANSFRQRWSTGIAYEIDPETAKQIIPFSNDAKYVGSDDPTAKFGDFADAKLEEFLKVIENFRLEIANVTGIPAWYFKPDLGQFPSGEALTKSEARFVALITDAQLDFGETWAEAIRLAMMIEGKKPNDAEIEVTWTAAAKLSPTEQANLAVIKKQFGVSNQQNLSENGYTDTQIKDMAKDNAQAVADAQTSFSKVFNAGTQAVGAAAGQ